MSLQKTLPMVAVLATIGLTACISTSNDQPTRPPTRPFDNEPSSEVNPLPQTTSAPPSSATLIEPERVVRTGDVADWFGGWSPDSRFYVFFRLSADAPCSGELVYAYDVKLGREIRLSSEDYCTRNVDPDTIWEGESTLLFGDGPDGGRWEAITLGDEITRIPLTEPPPVCIDRAYPVPPALIGDDVVRTRLSPDEKLVAAALVPVDTARRFDGIPGNQPDLHFFQRLNLIVLPVGDVQPEDLRSPGTIFDLGPDSVREDDCPGTQIRWSENGRYLISSMGPVIYDMASDEAVLAPDGPNSGPLGRNLRWSLDDLRVADDRILFDIPTGEVHELPGILPGFDRGFAGDSQLVYVTDTGMVAYDIASRSARQLTDFPLVLFAVSPGGEYVVYSEKGDLWLLTLPQ